MAADYIKRALARVFLGDRPEGWQPDIEEKLWLQEVASLTDDDEKQLERFDAGTLANMEVWDERSSRWIPASRLA